MKSSAGLVAAALFLITLSANAVEAQTAAAEKPEMQPVDGLIKWVYDYEEGKRISRETGKPMFVVIRCER